MLGWELPPFNSGGLGVASYNLCKALSLNNGIDIEFILPYNSQHNIDFMRITPAIDQSIKSIKRSGIAYDSFSYIDEQGQTRWLSMHDQQQIYEHAVSNLVENTTFDILHAHDWLTFRAALKVRERKNVPIILHVHSIESDRSGNKHGNPAVQDIEYSAMNLADRIIAVSNYTKLKIMEDYNVPENKIEVVHNKINPYEFVDYDQSNVYSGLAKFKEAGYSVVTSIGRLTIQKGLPNLLHAFKLVVEKNPKTILFIVGSGEQYRELIELAAYLNIGQNVMFADFQRGKNYRDAYLIGDLFVMPSVSEPFGITALEAIGYNSPILISKQSGVAEIIKNSLKVDFWDINEMANQISAVISDRVLHDELLNNSKREFENLSWDDAANDIHGIYNQFIGEAA